MIIVLLLHAIDWLYPSLPPAGSLSKGEEADRQARLPILLVDCYISAIPLVQPTNTTDWMKDAGVDMFNPPRNVNEGLGVRGSKVV